MSTHDHILEGAKSIEVAAMLGDSVVDVKHCMDPRGGKVTPKTWGFVAGSVACLLASATAFYVSVDTAAKNKAALDYHTRVLHKPTYSFRAEQLSTGVDWVAFGGLALGLLGMTAGLARMRGEKRSPYYRIGTAPGVEQPVEGAPSPDFPLVAPSGDEFVFNYGHGMDGELIVDGKSTPLAALAGTGLARPSTTTANAIEIPIPAKAKIRARAGQTTFLVSAVNKPRRQAVPLFSLEGRTAAYLAGSLAVHLGIVAFLQTIPEDDAGVSVTFNQEEAVALASNNTQPDTTPPEREQNDDDDAGDTSSAGAMALGDDGAAGKPDAVNADGHMRVKNNNAPPQLSREQAIEQAMNTGILGSYSQISGGIKAINGTADFSSGFDGADIYGPLFGAEGEGRGNFGVGVHGFGPGSNCYGTDCGIAGTGRYGTIGNGDKAGEGWGPGGPGKGRWRRRDSAVPTVAIPMPTQVSDGLDRAIIKRYVKRNLAKIQYCYESQLLAKPNLDGVVTVQFLISGNGTVSSSTGSGMDGTVANCVAGVVKNIAFPAPSNGSSVQVNYPFTFRAMAGR